jgi:hypothetical protein
VLGKRGQAEKYDKLKFVAHKAYLQEFLSTV